MVLMQPVLLFALLPWLAQQFLDGPPADDRHLLPPVRVEIPAEENAWSLLNDFESAYESQYEIVGESRMIDIELFLEQPEEWDEPDLSPLSEVFEKNRRAYEIAEEIVARPRYQPPFMEHIESPAKYIGSLRGVTDLLTLRAYHEYHLGRAPQAIDDALRMISLGHRVRSNPSSLIEQLVGNAIYNTGMEALLLFVGEGRANDELASVATRLQPFAPQPEHYALALRHEYAILSRSFQRMVDGKIPVDGLPLGSAATRFAWSVFLKPNRTKSLFVPRFSRLIDEAAETYAVAFASRFDPGEPNGLWLILSGNFGGNMMFAMIMPTMEHSRDGETKIRAFWSGLRAVLAIKRYEARTGELPSTLAELVPEYLAEVPVDPYDGKPVRYSREARMVRCVGTNLHEEGSGYGPTDGDEPTFRFK